MSRPGRVRDILFTTTRLGQLRTWFSNLDPEWKGWDYENNRFYEGAVLSIWKRNGQDALVLIRVPVPLLQDLLDRNPPNDLFTVYAQADPYADVNDLKAAAVSGDVMNLTIDPLYRRNVARRRSVFHKLRSNPTRVARLREFWPRTQPVYDNEGNQIGTKQVGLTFATFGEKWEDVVGDNE